MKVEKNYTEGKVTLSFGDAGTVTLNVSELNDDIKQKLAVYGAVAKVSRATAGKAKDDNAAYKAAKAVAEALESGTWSIARPSTADIQHDFMLNEIKATDPEHREEFIQTLVKAGIIEKLKITAEELEAARNA